MCFLKNPMHERGLCRFVHGSVLAAGSDVGAGGGRGEKMTGRS
jgi:hypothetical protein